MHLIFKNLISKWLCTCIFFFVSVYMHMQSLSNINKNEYNIIKNINNVTPRNQHFYYYD
jgi:hypothetical protein